MITTWDQRFLLDARHHSSHSKDPSTKVGAIFARNNNILSIGWNGFPRGIEDREDRLNNREVKYRYVVHAEMNGIYNATRNGISLEGSTLYVYGLPVCNQCSLGVIQVGVSRVVMQYGRAGADRWTESCSQAIENFKEVGIEFEMIVPGHHHVLNNHNIKETIEKLSKAALRAAVDRDEDLFRNHKL